MHSMYEEELFNTSAHSEAGSIIMAIKDHPLGTIEEAGEGSTSGESESERQPSPGPPEPPPQYGNVDSLSQASTFCESGEYDHDLEYEAMQAFYTRDVDKGHAWVVLGAVFTIFVVNAGMLYTSGVYYAKMLEEYGHSRSYTSLLGSLTNSFFMLIGPLTSIFIQRFGCRPSILLGGLTMVAGYLASAFTTSLEMLFVTYGIIAASGMNFCYSGQIIALAQYFDKWHSIATSVAMTGIGFGILFLSQLVEYCIGEYGWRGAFIIQAGLALQNFVCGLLIFPLPQKPHFMIVGREDDVKSYMQNPSKYSLASENTIGDLQQIQSQPYFCERHVNDRSFSSLRMSMEASYLTSSIMSINEDRISLHRVNTEHTDDGGLRSNQHSFISRRSYAPLTTVRANRSFHINELPGYAYPSTSYARKNSNTSNTSLSRAIASTMSISNSQSFIKEECETGEDISLKMQDQPNGNHRKFTIGDGLSVFEEEDEDKTEDTSESQQATFSLSVEHHTFCSSVLEKIKVQARIFLNYIKREKKENPLLDIRFWLINFGYFFCIVGTLTLFVIYKDFAIALDCESYYSIALSVIGVGDMTGRLTGGILTSTTWADPLVCFSLAMMFCGIVLASHLLVVGNGIAFLVLAVLFGFLYGIQNVLIAVVPARVFGREKLITVFGNILFLSGIGAFIGPPITGTIVDTTGSYVVVVIFSLSCLELGSLLVIIAYFVNKVKNQKSLLDLGESV